MYYGKSFDYFTELIDYLNENNIDKADIIHLQRVPRIWQLLWWESEDKDEKDNTDSSHVPNYGGCYNCDKTNECSYRGKPKLCRECDCKTRGTCPRYF